MNERNKEIYRLRQEGLTLKQIADKFVMSTERVRFICAREEDTHESRIT